MGLAFIGMEWHGCKSLLSQNSATLFGCACVLIIDMKGMTLHDMTTRKVHDMIIHDARTSNTDVAKM